MVSGNTEVPSTTYHLLPILLNAGKKMGKSTYVAWVDFRKAYDKHSDCYGTNL